MPTEQEILARAIAAGILDSAELEALEAQLAQEPTASSYDGRWGARLEALLRSERLDEATVYRLAGDPPSPSRPSSPAPAGQLGRYVLEALVGAGGNGRVFRAWDRALERRVALKLLRRDRGSAEALLEEARAQARIDHPNVCPIYEVGELEGQPYIAMQYLSGRTLKEVAPELSLEQRLRILEEVARAIHAAHRQGVVHRDLKPSNLMLEVADDGLRVYVTDFGLALPVSVNGGPPAPAGTPGYMAPEQERLGAPIDARTDVYGLGATLYELLTRRRPGLEPRPPPRALDPEVPRDLEAITAHAMAPMPDARYASAQAFADDLARFRRGEPVGARRGGWPYRVGKILSRHPRTFALATLASILGLGWFVQARVNGADAQRQVELVARFTEQVGRIEAQRRSSFMAPFHDVAQDEARLEQLVRQLEDSVAAGGRAAAGPGAYAQGRVQVLLQDVPQALAHLERAWSLGLRTSAMSAALGEALGDRYGQALEELGPKASSEARAEAQRRWRDPALEQLRRASAEEAEVSRLTAARIALYEEDFERARKEVAAGGAGQAWPADAWLLLGHIEDQAGGAARNRGAPLEAWQAHRRAAEAFAEAARLAPSHPDAHLGQCRALVNQLFIEVYDLDRDPAPTHAEAVSACERAGRVHSRWARPWQELARAHRLYATHLHGLGRSEGRLLDRAIAAGEEALRRAPDSDEPYDTLSNVYRVRGARSAEGGAPYREDLRRAITLSTRAIERRPRDARLWNDLGNGYAALATAGTAAGAADWEAFAAAEQAYRRSIALAGGTHPSPWINLGALDLDYAELSEPPERELLLLQARLQLQAGLQLHRADPYAWALLGRTIAQLPDAEGTDLEEASAAIARAQALDPTSWHGYAAGAILAEVQARSAEAVGQDPQPARWAAHEAWLQALALNPGHPEVQRGEAESWARLYSAGRLSPWASIQR